MKLAFLGAAALAVGAVQSAPAAAQAEISLEGIPADELEVARDIITVTFPVEKRDEIFGSMIGEVGSQFAKSAMSDPIFEEPGIRAIMDEFLSDLPTVLMPTVRKHMPAMLEAAAVAYTREFNLQELREIRAFAQTDAGGHYFRTATSLLSDPAVAKANEAYFADIQIEKKAVGAGIGKKVTEYLIANPEVLERIQTRSAE